ncbi:hypothetical protein GF380_05555 [Candidatus Uhrbacteria bacterium]|nr:hypothetical protein [Candidatus Uhrbacteria bacterium]MBD3284481.1 hypothetical protein [Candidatus Uhrbacteria bacterium]
MDEQGKTVLYYLRIFELDQNQTIVSSSQVEGEYFEILMTAGFLQYTTDAPILVYTEIETVDGEHLLIPGMLGNMTDHPVWRYVCRSCARIDWSDRPTGEDDCYICESCKQALRKNDLQH